MIPTFCGLGVLLAHMTNLSGQSLTCLEGAGVCGARQRSGPRAWVILLKGSLLIRSLPGASP